MCHLIYPVLAKFNFFLQYILEDNCTCATSFFVEPSIDLTVPYERENLNFSVGGVDNLGMENKDGASLNLCSSM